MSLNIVVTENKPGLVEVALDGRLDTETAPQLEQCLAPIMAKGVRALRFDLERLKYVSSMGIRVLFNTFKALRAKKAMFLMAHLQPQIKKVLEIAQALPAETMFASIAEADAYYDAMQRKALGQEPEE